MTVKLEIKEDAELRAHVKDLIKGQVAAIVREEFKGFIADELQRLASPTVKRDIDYLIPGAVSKSITVLVGEKAAELGLTNEYIGNLVTQKIDAALANTNWDELVSVLANEKIKKLIDKTV